MAGQVGAPSTPPTPEEIETGRKYGAMIAQQLVTDIQNMGMPAIEAGPGSLPPVGDGIIPWLNCPRRSGHSRRESGRSYRRWRR